MALSRLGVLAALADMLFSVSSNLSVACLRRSGARYQLAPAAALPHWPGLCMLYIAWFILLGGNDRAP